MRLNRFSTLFRVMMSLFVLLSTLGTPSIGVAQSNLDGSNNSEDSLQTTLSDAIETAITNFVATQSADVPYFLHLLTVQFNGNQLTLDLAGDPDQLGETLQGELMSAIDHAVSTLLPYAEYPQRYPLEYRLLFNGKPRYEIQPPVVSAAALDGIQGKRIVISPGHGRYDNWRGSWPQQRGNWWGIVEDNINLDLIAELSDLLVPTGADVRPTRQLSKSAGQHRSGYPWWEMDASEYIGSLGAPESVWKVDPRNDPVDRDIIARPEYANWISADMMVSIHNNGGGGCGTQTLYDLTNGYQTQSRRLAELVQGRLTDALRREWNNGWCSRGATGYDGNYGENRRFRGPAVIVELAFMDNRTDNGALQDARFRTIAMRAIRDAVVEYFGGTSACPNPTGGLCSDGTPNNPPSISFNSANSTSADVINSREQNWSFAGTASDPEGKLSRIEFKCEGDSCNAAENIGSNGNWNWQRSGLSGFNRIHFAACDDIQCINSRTVTLRVDLASPTSFADANGQSNPSGWFRSTVDVKLRAQDNATGNALVGVGELRYRIDGGSWQAHKGDSKTITINSDGQHTVEYYAIDNVGNEETPHKTISFQIDATPPTAPGAASERGGTVNNQWQKSINAPTFTWGAASDSTSGLHHYELYFGTDATSDQIQSFVAADASRLWTPLPNGVRTGSYYLRARVRDNAGNYSHWNTLFTFRFDSTPPPNPTAASHADKLISERWQRITASANFTWTAPSDEGSGIKGYYIYWGDQANGKDESAAALRTGSSYQSAATLCATGQVCTGYLRLRTLDNVDNLAGNWSTLFVVRYDGVAPNLNFTINGGVTQTAQTQVVLNLDASDEPGSGVSEMRSFASDSWSPWEPYQHERIETIPAISQREWPIYVQVRDGVGWESSVISKSVFFDLYRPQPQSANYWLFASVFNSGNGNHSSASYKLNSTLGQSVDSEALLSSSYIISGGFQAASMAIPLQAPERDQFYLINSVFASGIVNNTMTSDSFRLLSSIGEPGLPNNSAMATLLSTNYQLRPGFLAAFPSQFTSPTPPPSPTPEGTPTPQPTSGCEFATLTINNGALFTNGPNVSLNLCAPHAEQMAVSNDGNFNNALWESFQTSRDWTLTTLGQNVVARMVQARFKDENGNSYHYAADDIIYDPIAPGGSIAINDPVPVQQLREMGSMSVASADQVQSSAAMESFTEDGVAYLNRLGEQRFDTPVPLLVPSSAGNLELYLIAQDDNSGLQGMQIGEDAHLSSATWQPYDGLTGWTPSSGDGAKQIYARFRDGAGNASSIYSATVVIDSQPPSGSVDIEETMIGRDTVKLHLKLTAKDNLSGVDALRLSHTPTLADAPWQPFATEITWHIQVNANEAKKVIYLQLRDAVGNVSQNYSDEVLIDRQPPVVTAQVSLVDSLERTLSISAHDELSALTEIRLSNDPLMSLDVVTIPYTDTVDWTFDARRVVWIQVEDAVGNLSEPYPAYAALFAGETVVDQRIYLPLINR